MVAKRAKSLLASTTYSTSSLKVTKTIVPRKFHFACYAQTMEIWEQDQRVCTTSSNSPLHYSQQSSDVTIRRLRFTFDGIEFLMARHRKFLILVEHLTPKLSSISYYLLVDIHCCRNFVLVEKLITRFYSIWTRWSKGPKDFVFNLNGAQRYWLNQWDIPWWKKFLQCIRIPFIGG